MKKVQTPFYKKYYWLLAGIGVGIFSVVMAWFNINILVPNNDLTLTGSLIVIAEYTVLVYGLSVLKNYIK